MAEQKSITISTIPIPKLTVLMNNFICNTVTHLNKLSVKGDEKLAEFDKKLNDLEIMTTLLEAKLNSLPENIKSNYPELQPCHLDDINPTIPIGNTGKEIQGQPEEKDPPEQPIQPDEEHIPEPDIVIPDPDPDNIPPDGKGGENDNLPPEEALENFLKQHEKYRNVLKMLKLGVPTIGVKQKVKTSGLDLDILEQLIVLAHKVYPQINVD